MAWHIVRPFAGVLKPGRVFRNETVEEFMEIAPGGGIGVFHNDEAATGVADKNRYNPFCYAGACKKVAHGIRDLHGAFAAGFDLDGFVTNIAGFHRETSDSESNRTSSISVTAAKWSPVKVLPPRMLDVSQP